MSAYCPTCGSMELTTGGVCMKCQSLPFHVATTPRTPMNSPVSLPTDEVEGVVQRLNLMISCGCCDDEWPELRRDTVKLIDRLAMEAARPKEQPEGARICTICEEPVQMFGNAMSCKCGTAYWVLEKLPGTALSLHNEPVEGGGDAGTEG